MNKLLAHAILVSVILLGYAVGSVAPAAPAPPSADVEFVGHDARRPLRAGDRFTVSLKGTAQGSATFHISGVVTDIGMRETRGGAYQAQAGTYTGTYIVRPGDAARRAAIIGTLVVRGVEAVAASKNAITIDTHPPRVLARYPKPDSRLANVRPNISIEFVDLETDVNPASVRLLVNGQNVTPRASISGTSVSYNPETPFQPGAVRVQLTVGDRAGNTLRVEWTFHVTAPGGLISSVTTNPASTLTRDEVLTVVATGVPGAHASFSIQGVRGAWPMKESGTKGVYFGTMVVGQQTSVLDAPILVTFERNGQKSTAPASVPMTILPGQPPAPTVASPSRTISLEESARLILGGASRPGFRILGRVDYEARSAGLDGAGPLGEFLTIAGADGSWRTSLGPLVPLGPARLIVTVVAIDPAGRRSPPATLELTSS